MTSNLTTDVANRLNRDSLSLNGYLNNILPNPDPIMRKAGIFHSQLEEMMSDTYIAGLFGIRTGGTFSYEWRVKRGNATEEMAKIFSDYIEQLSMSALLPSVLESVLTGVEVFECVYEEGGKLWLPTVEQKPREWFSFNTDNELVYFPTDNITNGEVVWKQKTDDVDLQCKYLLARHKPSYKQPYGKALLTEMWWNYIFKKEGKMWWAIFMELFGTPWTIAKYEEGSKPDKIDEFVSKIINMKASRVLATPDSSSVELLTTTSSQTSGHEQFIEDARKEISIRMLGHESMASKGNSKLGNDTTELTAAEWVIQHDATLFQDFINRLFKNIYTVNRIAGTPPIFEMYQREQVDTKTPERDAIDYSIGVRHKKEYFLRTRGYSESEIEIEHESVPQVSSPPASFSAEIAQREVDRWVDQLTSDTARSEALINEMTATIQQYLDGVDSFESALAGFSALFPEIDSPTADAVFEEIATLQLHGYFSALTEERGE